MKEVAKITGLRDREKGCVVEGDTRKDLGLVFAMLIFR